MCDFIQTLISSFPVLLVCIVTKISAQSAPTLDCDFDVGLCGWENDANDAFDWRTGTSVAVDGWHSIPRTITGTGSFAYAQGRYRPEPKEQAAQAILRSPQISGLTAAATLSFNYWKTAIPPNLQICTQDEGSAKFRCLDSIKGSGPQSWTRRVVTIPANPLTFTVVFMADNFNTELDLLGLDDVTFRVSGTQLDYGQQQLFTVNQVEQSRVQFPFQNNAGQLPPSVRTHIQTGIPRQPATPRQPPRAPFPTPPSRIVTNSNNIQFVAPPAAPSPSQPFSNSNRANFEQTLNTVLTPTTISPNDLNAVLLTRDELQELFDNNEASGKNIPSGGSNRLGTDRRVGACRAVACDFSEDTCKWSPVFQANYDWKIYNRRTESFRDGIPNSERNSYVYANGGARYSYQRAALYSDQFVVPQSAFLEFFVYFSAPTSGRISLYQNDNSNFDTNNPFKVEHLVWQVTGYEQLGALGWARVTVPLRPSSDPMTIVIAADDLSVVEHFIGVDSIALIDGDNNEIGCAMHVAPSTRTLALPPQQLTVQTDNNLNNRQRWRSVDTQDQWIGNEPDNELQRRIEDASRLANLNGPRVIRIEQLTKAQAARTPTASVEHHAVVHTSNDALDTRLLGAHVWKNNVDVTKQLDQPTAGGRAEALVDLTGAIENLDAFKRHTFPPVWQPLKNAATQRPVQQTQASEWNIPAQWGAPRAQSVLSDYQSHPPAPAPQPAPFYQSYPQTAAGGGQQAIQPYAVSHGYDAEYENTRTQRLQQLYQTLLAKNLA